MATNASNPSVARPAKVLGIVREQLAEILEKSPDEIVRGRSLHGPGRRLAGPDRTGRSTRREAGYVRGRVSHRRRGPRGAAVGPDAVDYVLRQAPGSVDRRLRELLLASLAALANDSGSTRTALSWRSPLTHSSDAAEQDVGRPTSDSSSSATPWSASRGRVTRTRAIRTSPKGELGQDALAPS